MKIQDFLYAGSSWNVEVFHDINNIQEPFFQQAAYITGIMAKYTMFPVYLLLIILCAWQYGVRIKVSEPAKYPYYRENIRLMLVSLVTSYIAYILWVSGLKHLLHMPRPFAILPEGSMHITEIVKSVENPYVSMPSGHSAFAMMLLVCLWPILNDFGKTLGTFLLVWVGISRIALGVHFPSDVLFSFLIAYGVTSLVCEIVRKCCVRSAIAK